MAKSGLWGWIFIILGTIFFLEKLGVISQQLISYSWPLIIIAIGIGIVLRPNKINQ